MNDEINSDDGMDWEGIDDLTAESDLLLKKDPAPKQAHIEYDDIFDYNSNDKQPSLGYYDKLLQREEMMDLLHAMKQKKSRRHHHHQHHFHHQHQ